MDVRSLLETVGNAADADPAVRGATIAGAALALVLGLAWRAARGRRAPPRAKIRVDAPEGQPVEVRVGREY